MNTEVPTHQKIWEALPWIINGTATAEQREQVNSHLSQCNDCRDEFALQRLIHDGMNAETTPNNLRMSLQQLLHRIDTTTDTEEVDCYEDVASESKPSPVIGGKHRRLWSAGIAALLLQSTALTLMMFQLYQNTNETNPVKDEYRTLSQLDATNPTATIRFVPAPDLSVSDLQKLLDEVGVRIVDSRSGNAIYGLAFRSDAETTDTDRIKQTISRLRSKPGVLLVEPIAASP